MHALTRAVIWGSATGMDLRQLRYFAAVATLRSFSRAADQLHVAQSAVSRQVQALEEEVGVELLRRKPLLQPTEAGTLLLERASSIIGQVRTLRDEVREYAKVPRGTLRVGMVPFSSQPFMPRAIANFGRAFPGVRVQVQTGMSGVLSGSLRDNVIDIAVMHSPWTGPEFNAEALVYGSMVLVLPPACAAGLFSKPKEAYAIDEIAAMPLILATKANPQRILLEGAAVSRGLTLNVAMEADNLGTILALVHEGVGCTVIAYGAVHAMLGSAAVRIASLTDPIQTNVSLVTAAARPVTAAMRLFRGSVRAEVEAVAATGEMPSRFFQLAPPPTSV